MNNERKWKGKTGGNLLGQWGLIVLFKFLDIRIVYFLMSLVVPFYMLFAAKRAKAIYHYFRKQFNCSRWKSLIKTYQNHFIFGQVVLDRFAVFAGNKNIFELELIGYEHFERLENGKKGFITASSHIGNFEIGGYMLRSKKKKMNALIYAGETKTVQANRTKILGDNNINLIPVLDDMSHLFAVHAALQQGEIVSMPCDRNLGSAKSVTCDFLNGKADFPVGAFALATTFEVEVLAIFIIKKSSKKYTAYIKPVKIDDETDGTKREKIERYVRSYVKEVETIVREYPEQWFNYYEFWKE
ncbi:MAG: lysophospholipid acyltransferase family protein, partial [Candidatus Symbiothrix sp.]|nr:lysophospholipid acyltransferase family protein [Candidatus Symbiothrix sp.]